MRMDFTLNVPSMLTMLGMIVSTAVAGVSIYQDLKDRQMTTNFAVVAQAQRIEKIEISLGQLKLEQNSRNTELRAEIKSDIADIKDMLNSVIFGGPGRNHSNTTLREWRK